jgi:hypothetical protein
VEGGVLVIIGIVTDAAVRRKEIRKNESVLYLYYLKPDAMNLIFIK